MECLTFLKPFRSAHSGIETQENAVNKSLCISPLLTSKTEKKNHLKFFALNAKHSVASQFFFWILAYYK